MLIDRARSPFLPMSAFQFHQFPEGLPEKLWDAVARNAYPALYACLRKIRSPFSPEFAYGVCSLALDCKLTLRAFTALLDRCPPPEDFACIYKENVFPGLDGGLMEKSASLGRCDVLDLLLSRGLSPNRQPQFDLSPLEAALAAQSIHCVDRLVRCPDLDTAWTEALLSLWARAFNEQPLLEFCLQSLIPRFFPQPWSPMEPLPIPPGLTPAHAAAAESWPLLRRLCRKAGSIPLRQGRDAVKHFSVCVGLEEEQPCAAALADLLNACPRLLQYEAACQKLVHCFLCFHECAIQPLAPWIERIRNRSVTMPLFDWNHPSMLLERWPIRLPNGPSLALDRNSAIFSDNELERLFSAGDGGPLTRQQFEELLRTCPIRGKARKGVLSALARDALLHASPAFLDTLLQPGGLLGTEDPKALLDCVMNEEYSRTKRAVVMARVRQEADYAL